MIELLRFKITAFALRFLYLFFRVGLRVVYGKEERDQLLLDGHFELYHRLNRKKYSMLWASSKYGNESWEPQVSKFLKNIKGSLFIDIGSSIGYYTLLLAGNFTEVIAVEPEPESYRGLLENTGHLDNVRTVRAAISDEEGETTLYVSPTIGWHTLIPRPEKTFRYSASKTRTMTLGTLLKDKRASLVKVDTEGAELVILDGAVSEQVEAWLVEAHWGAERKHELEEKLGKMGYETTWITENHIYANNNCARDGLEGPLSVSHKSICD